MTATQSRSSGDSMSMGLTTRIRMKRRESGPRAMRRLRSELGDERPFRGGVRINRIAQNLVAVLLTVAAAARRGILAEVVADLLRLRLRPLLLQLQTLLPDDAARMLQ